MTTTPPSWSGGYRDLPREHGFEPLRVDGTIPPELAGTLYRCGPARTSCFGHRYRHWFDGDGAVTAVRIADGVAWGATRVVDTPGLLAERRAGRALFPAYGTLPPGPRRPLPRPKNAANVAMMAWDDRLFALHEGGPPTELEPDDLRTLGEHELGLPLVRDGFSAHPHRGGAARGLYNVGVHHGAVTRLAIFELRDHVVRTLATVPLAGPTMIHDFALTERYLVVFAPPLRLQVHAFASGLVSYGDALAWQPEHGTEVVVVPLDDPGAVVRFTAPPWYQWHVANAHDRAGEIVVDLVRYPDFASNAWMASLAAGRPAPDVRPGTLVRATVDPLARSLRLEELAAASIEFPRVAPSVESSRHAHVYACAHGPGQAAGPYDRLVRIDVDSGRVLDLELGPDQYPSEPVFVARGPAEDDGWLLTVVYAPAHHATHLAILDARQPGAGPIARAWFDHHIPFTLHGLWRAGHTRIERGDRDPAR